MHEDSLPLAFLGGGGKAAAAAKRQQRSGGGAAEEGGEAASPQLQAEGEYAEQARVQEPAPIDFPAPETREDYKKDELLRRKDPT